MNKYILALIIMIGSINIPAAFLLCGIARITELRTYAGQNPLGIDWRHDATVVLRGISLPTLWMRAEKDRESPMGVTGERIRTLQKEGKPIELVIFPNTDHGVIEFNEAPDGKRTYTRFADGYNRLIVDWVKGRL